MNKRTGHLPRQLPKRLMALLLANVFACLAASAAMAQERPAPTVLSVMPIRGGAYWVAGGRANTGFVIGKTGVIVIDAQMTPDAVNQELAAIGKLTSKPVSTLIITHADPDHVGGAPWYPASANIIEQENANSEVIASAADPAAGPMMGPMYQKLLSRPPSRTIGNREDTVIDGVRVDLIHVAPAHTSGDLIIYLPAEKIVYAGDIITTNLGRFPVIHLGGSSLGWIASMQAILALDATTYVGGHGAFETKDQLQARIRDAQERREAIKSMIAQHKSLAQIEAALPDPGASPMFLTFTQTVYSELTQGYPPASPPWLNLVHR